MVTTNSSYKYWWLTLIVGILAIICGIWVMNNPVSSYFALSIYFALMFLIIGIGEISSAISQRHYKNWGWTLAVGILDIIVGILLLANIWMTAEILPYVVGFLLLFWGISFIGWAIQFNQLRMKNWGWVLAGGILLVIFSLLIIIFPLFGAINIVVWTGIAFIMGGIAAIGVSLAQKG